MVQKTPPAPVIPKKTHELARVGVPDMSARVREHNMRVIQEDEARILELLPDRNPERRQLPESIFREHFLPIVSGEAFKSLPPDYTPQRLSDEATEKWAQVAGSLQAEVEVMESDGTVAFVFPALMDTAGLRTRLDAKDEGLAAVAKEYRHRQQGMPAIADRILESGLAAKLTTLLGTADSKPAQAMMQKVFDYYGIERPNAKKEANDTKGPNPDDYSF